MSEPVDVSLAPPLSTPGNAFNPPDRSMPGTFTGSLVLGSSVEPVDEPEGPSIRLLGPWLIREFKTPLLPGVVLSADGTNRELDAEETATMRDEAVRCGFNVATTGLGDEHVASDSEGGK